MLIVRLVKEDIFSVVALSRILFQDSFPANAMLLTQLLPKLVTNYNISYHYLKDFVFAYFDCRIGQLAK